MSPQEAKIGGIAAVVAATSDDGSAKAKTISHVDKNKVDIELEDKSDGNK